MKLLSLICCILISNAYASDIAELCSKQIGGTVLTESKSLQLVGDNCLAEDYFTISNEATDMSKVKEFLALEEKVGQAVYDLGYVSQMKFYRTARGYKLNYGGISYPLLKDLANFGINSLGVYSVEDIYGSYWDFLDIIKEAKQMNAAGLSDFLAGEFFDTNVDSDNDDVQLVKEEFARRNALYQDALLTITNLLTNNSKNSVTVYPLLDNNNENVQDAQWVVVGRNFVIVINRFWYL